MAEERGIGKCEESHAGSYGYPTRPEERYQFCAQCGKAMVWACPDCDAALPDDNNELISASFCRECGAAYFPERTDAEKA